MNDLTVVIPVFQEDKKTVEGLYYSITELGAQCIVVDDGNSMDLDIPHETYAAHVGYGYAIKCGIDRASRPLVLTMDGDNEHRVEDVTKLYTVFNLITNCTMLIGCRWNKKESKIRWIGRKAINFIATCLSRHMLPDLNSGLRIFRRNLAISYKPILCDTFSFTTSITMSFVTDGHKVAWFPIDTNPRIYGKSHVKLWKDGWVTIFYVVWIGIALRTRKIRKTLRTYFSFFHRSDV